MGGKKMFCKNCGKEIDDKAEICPHCGVRIRLSSKGEKNPGLAAVFSFFFPGLGQIYNGEIGKGIFFIVMGGVFAILMIVLIGFILYPLFWIYNIYDAYKTAERINLTGL